MEDKCHIFHQSNFMTTWKWNSERIYVTSSVVNVSNLWMCELVKPTTGRRERNTMALSVKKTIFMWLRKILNEIISKNTILISTGNNRYKYECIKPCYWLSPLHHQAISFVIQIDVPHTIPDLHTYTHIQTHILSLFLSFTSSSSSSSNEHSEECLGQ